MGQLNKIDHIVVLMLENRSFDNLLGMLYPKSASFEGLDPNLTNPGPNGARVQVWNQPGTDESTMRIPDPDPGELWEDINTQLFGVPSAPPLGAVPDMSGFVKNYLTQKDNPIDKDIMHYFMPSQVPVITTLAKQFAVCDHWFASAPCQTWPNRWFVHAATASGRENNEPVYFPDAETIYNRCELAGNVDWKIYFHEIAQAKSFVKLLPLYDHFHLYSQFQADCQAGTLPNYSFIEPRYYDDFVNQENDMHPPSVVTLGEQLIADVYNCIRASKLWPKTMLVITFDEHGGCFDHVPPPSATMPEAPRGGQRFNFDRYGVRVPAVIVSPYVEKGRVLRPAGSVPYDHTSIIATLRKRFPNLGAPLTMRDAAAPDLDDALSLTSPDNKGPSSVKALPYSPTPATAAVAHLQPLNGMQEALVGLAANLPTAPGVDLKAHLASMAASPVKLPPINALADVRAATAYVKQQVSNLFMSA
jgi:phospholipase C